ncbi:PREDICTED: plasma protease C1 inhibitor [Gavialis gangeticus]|uniref:plasma protease C1 inhibitor n=1 Tax=Gavialis gangeticus TaxID=94835 RepID=UPI00092F1582|nr:PREDICTED: plasma protease C1 inhibitor [Gavialis gangeticus]XP_019370144.1 PREDICTED: plasma protease C1 inhibitor [Gavialis gangeticus]
MRNWLILVWLAVALADNFTAPANNEDTTGDKEGENAGPTSELLGEIRQDDTPILENKPQPKEVSEEEEEDKAAWEREAEDQKFSQEAAQVKSSEEETTGFSPDVRTADEEEANRTSKLGGGPEEYLLGGWGAVEPDTNITTEPVEANTTEPVPAPDPISPHVVSLITPPRCTLSDDPWSTCGSVSLEDKARVARALTDFALKFYKAAGQMEGMGTNMVFSPLNVALGISHLLLGAQGDTRERLSSLLSYPPDLPCVHGPLKQLIKSKALLTASQIFHRKGLQINKAFLNHSRRFSDSRPQALSGNETLDLQRINKWVSEKTNGKIKKLMEDLATDVQLVLLSAIYLQSKWKTTFNVKDTQLENFYRQDKSSVKVPMMTSKKYPLASFTDSSLQAKLGRLQLSNNMSLVIIIPQRFSQILADVEEKLNTELFSAVMDKLMGIPFKPTVLTMPKFKLDSSQDLMAILGEIDYGLFFDANLCGISEDEELAVSAVQHRAVLELSEAGVEAAAAMAISVARSALFFEVQQPFLFLVWNDQHGFPIFMGRVNDPSA